MQLSNKTVLVSGASSGIGRQTCIAISEAGGRVVATGRDTDRLSQTMNDLTGTGHLSFAADLTEETQIADLIAQMPNLNGVVHCAGIVKPFPVKFIGKKQIDEVFGINYTAAVLLTAQLLRKRKLAEGSSLVFISSISARHPYTGGGLYVSSKAALEAFSRTVALEMASKGMRSNCLSPALVKTPIFEQTQTASAELIAKHEREYPLGLGMPKDIANAVVFLLSDVSRWITGTNLPMDGGLTLGSK